MEDASPLATREQYLDIMVDALLRDAAEIEKGFLPWCERHVPLWRKAGYDETWVRTRIALAQRSRNLHRSLRERGLTLLEIREQLRRAYAEHPDLYDLALARERTHPGLLRYRGNTGDFRQRYTLRVLVYETDKLAYEQFCLWGCISEIAPFSEQPDNIRVTRDLSTVERLELMLAMNQYFLQLFQTREPFTPEQIAPLMEAYGKQLREAFLAKQGYPPEDSDIPYIPVTIDGPQDPTVYFAQENL